MDKPRVIGHIDLTEDDTKKRSIITPVLAEAITGVTVNFNNAQLKLIKDLSAHAEGYYKADLSTAAKLAKIVRTHGDKHEEIEAIMKFLFVTLVENVETTEETVESFR